MTEQEPDFMFVNYKGRWAIRRRDSSVPCAVGSTVKVQTKDGRILDVRIVASSDDPDHFYSSWEGPQYTKSKRRGMRGKRK